MKSIYLIIAVLALLFGVGAFVIAYNQKNQASIALEKTISDLRDIQNAVPSNPNSSQNQTPVNLAGARAALARAASRVSSIKGGLTGSVSGKSEAINTIEHARRELANIEAQSLRMMNANAEFMVALTNLQSQYEVKISDLERQINDLKTKKSGIGLEYLIGLMGLVTAFSTLLLGWRKDNREAKELKMEIAKFKATT